LAAVVARQLMLAPSAGGGEPAPGEVIAETSRALFAAAGPIVIRGTEGMALQASSCCSPIPGDAIVGHMRKDQGLALHQADCPVAARGRRADPERWIDLQWAEDATGPFAAKLALSAANERGTLARIAVAIAEAESNIVNVNMEDESAEQAQLNFKLQVRDRRHLARVMRVLRRVPQVSRVVRVKPGDKGGSE
jgi:GTP pyrophosphokinase